MARGFSLFEMVIVMGIIGLILGGAIYSMGRIKDSAAVSTSRQDMTSFSSALEAYKNIGGKYPSTSQGLEALLKRPQSSPQPRDWVQTLNDERFFLTLGIPNTNMSIQVAKTQVGLKSFQLVLTNSLGPRTI